jgi:serine/threonine-protein kinase
MMYVDGETLGERLRAKGPLAPSLATRMLREVSQALAYAHGRGVVHRDIKPDNILLERGSGRALVTDFGIAGSPHAEVAGTDRIVGTVHFMSPEQAAGLPVDARSDLYSLGVVAHVALSGRLPRRDVPHGGSDARLAGESLALVAPSTPRHLVAAIERALTRDPGGRFETAEAFAEAVERATVARPAIPAPIRSWLSAQDPWRVPYFLWIVGWLITAANESMGHDRTFFLFSLVLSAIPAIPATLFQLRTMRRLLDAGYTLDDVRAAIPVWEAEESEELSAHDDERSGWFAPIARTVAWASVGTMLMLATGEINHLVGELGRMVIIVGGAAALPLLTALGVPVLPEVVMAAKPLRRHFWEGPIGGRIERLMQRGRRALAPANAFRPTEAVVRSAVDALWLSLPTAYQERLAELPGVVKRLETHASRARATLLQAEESPGRAHSTEHLGVVRERARRDLEAAVTALESIRLDLLRLLGGDSDLAPTTTVLDAARRVDDDLTRLREAQREVERVVRPIGLDLRPHTPG